MKNTKILVTGGAGFVGSMLCEALLKSNNTVVCLDNFSTGKMDAIKHLMQNQNFKIIGGDIRNEEDCKRACKNIDVVFHQAVLNAGNHSYNNPIAIHNVNTSGFVNILMAAQEATVKGVVYCHRYLTTKDTVASNNTALSIHEIANLTNELYVNLFKTEYGLKINEIKSQPISVKSSKEAIATFIQLHLEALEGITEQTYKLV